MSASLPRKYPQGVLTGRAEDMAAITSPPRPGPAARVVPAAGVGPGQREPGGRRRIRRRAVPVPMRRRPAAATMAMLAPVLGMPRGPLPAGSAPVGLVGLVAGVDLAGL